MIIPKENAKDIPKGHLGLKIFAVDTAEDAFEKIFAEPIEIEKNSVRKKISLVKEKSSVKDAQIKKISATKVTPEELEMLITSSEVKE